MSTLKLENIKHENSSTNNMVMDSDGSTRTTGIHKVDSRLQVGNSSITQAYPQTNFGYVADFQASAGTQTYISIATPQTASLGSGGVVIGEDATDTYITQRGNKNIKLATQDITRMNISGDGIVTKPNNPSFHAGISANDNRASGYYNHSTGSAWVVVSNVGGHFSNGTFTAPVTGVYQFQAMLVAAYVDQYLQYWNVAFEKNGSGHIGQNWTGYRSGQATYKSVNNQCCIYLQANDYIRIKSECNTTINTLGHSNGLNSMFSGFLVG